ncbi:MAG: TetR family transcriptional regulator [Actinomycetota bacterium]|nr:TetR family transcriptional regulator [Actinomycetota bacterium]
MSQPRPGLRERNHERTRAEIAEHALALFAAHGFDDVTVDDIAASAGISRRTFFRYFDTKDDALLPEDASRLRRLEQALRTRPPEEGAFDAVRGAVLELAQDYETSSEEFLQQARLVLATPSVHARSLGHQADWEGVIRTFAAERAGHAETSLLPQLLAAGCMAALRAALTTWLHDDGRTDLVALATAALEALGDGLRHQG